MEEVSSAELAPLFLSLISHPRLRALTRIELRLTRENRRPLGALRLADSLRRSLAMARRRAGGAAAAEMGDWNIYPESTYIGRPVTAATTEGQIAAVWQSK